MSAHLIVLRERIEGYRYIGAELIRMLFGLFLVGKGYLYSENSAELITLIGLNYIPVNPDLIIHTFIAIHVGGGLMVAIGLFTRTILFLQLPVILWTVITTFMANGILSSGMHFESAVFAFLILVWLTFSGSGKVSIDHLMLEKSN